MLIVKKTLIIGATSAIAQAICERLGQQGSELFLVGRNPEKLNLVASALKTKYGIAVHTLAFDFNDFECHAPAIEEADKTLGGLDAAFICHGTLSDQKACENDSMLAQQEIRTNFLSPISFLTHLANLFEKRGAGTLVAISSVAGDRGRQSNYVYGAAKAGLSAFLQGLRNRLSRKGIRVITVKPGFVATPMTANLRSSLMVSPDTVANDILKAVSKDQSVCYTPWFWRWIMLIIKSIPERIFRKLSL